LTIRPPALRGMYLDGGPSGLEEHVELLLNEIEVFLFENLTLDNASPCFRNKKNKKLIILYFYSNKNLIF